MNLILMTPFPPPMGGIANWSVLMKNYFSENNNDINVTYINTASKKRETEGNSFLSRFFYGTIGAIENNIQLRKTIKKRKVDAIHVNTSGSLALFRAVLSLKTARKYNINSVLHIRFGRIPELLSKNNWECRILKKAISLANKVIAIDSKTYEALKKLYNEKIVNIPNPFNPNSMPKPRFINEQVCTYNITFLGWVIKTKGIEELISAWENISTKYENWSLNVVGPYKVEYLDDLRKKYSFKKVNVIGELEHYKAMELINNSEIFILPSYTEGFPNVIIEALYLGKPIIATNVGAIPEMLKNDAGIVINPKCSYEIKENIEMLISNYEKRISLSKNANQKSKEYMIDNIIEKYKEVWFKK